MTEMILNNMCNTFSQWRCGILPTQNDFILIKFSNSERRQARRRVRYKEIMMSIANILDIKNDNCFSFINNVEYI